MTTKMTVGLLKDIAPSRPKERRLMGMDVGKTTLGLALSDPAQGFATPLQTIKRTKFTKDMEVLAKIVREYEVGGFILGLPLNMDGSEGPRCQSVRDFAAEMARRPEVVGPAPWIAFWDERLSTVSVEEFVDTFVEKRKKRVDAKASGLIDKLAAQSILQGALDFLN
jgi:putative holliday junction resolvase